MEANELRIGNWVYYRKHPVQVTEIDGCPSDPCIMFEPRTHDVESCVLNSGKDDGYEYITPIPLTEELTLKVALQLYKEGLEVQKSTSDETYILYDALTGQCIRADIKYVHEFQNLYYSLTGKELTV